MQKLRIYISVFAAFLILTAAMTVLAADELKIVYNVGVAPLKFEDAASRPAGLFPDIWRLWAGKAGKEVQFVKVDSFKESLQLLKDGKVDLHAGLFRTPKREEFLDYSEQLLALDYYIFTHPSVHPIKSLGKTSGFIVGIQKGGYTEQFVRSKVPANRIVVYDRFQDLFRAALEGEIKVFVATELSLLYYLKDNWLINIFEYDRDHPLYSQVYYTATKKGNPALIQQVNDGLNAIGSEERRQLEDKWIVQDFREIPEESAAALPEKETRVALSAKEQAFLKAHPVIRVHNEKDWPPFNYFEYGTPRGLSIDYMNLVAEQLGIKVEYVTGPSWNEFLGMVKRKELDVMLNIVKTEDRLKYLLYTEPYIKNPNVIVSSERSPYETIQALFGKTVAFPKGFFYEEVLTKSFSRVKRLPVEDTLASLKAVTFGRADAALGEAAVMRTLINKNLLSGLRISGEVNIGDPDLTNLRLGVRDDWPLLPSALMKAMAAITPQEMNQIRQKWIVVDVPTTSQETAVPIFYGRLIAYAIAVFLILSLLAWILIKAIKKEHIAVSFGSRWFRGLVLAGLSFFVIIVGLLGWFTLERNREKILESVGENLTEILKTADDRLNLWVEQRTSSLKLLGRDPELVTLTKRLLAVTPDREDLTASDALRDARAFFKTNKDIFSNIGFFIINTDNISIGSMRDTNIGTRNLISLQKPDLLRKAFEGDVLFVPPIESDVPLGNGPKADRAGNPSTKFFMGPIRDANGQIIAVMTLRVDPSEDFSRVLTSFEMRKTFETYAFNEHGKLLSESRLDEQLRRIGLIAEGQQSASNIAIRDPGVNLVKGLHPKIERSQQPLTRMASRAIQLKLDMETAGQTYGHSKIEIDTNGYRDFRGVPVFGAWLSNADLGLGLATEIDVAEAL
ncbi:MAG: transporter substrate-binding domain-containing protein, partial [Deltaproteobacteria bacterium]|nr:transporter substrate-binding domain-containing protein [Deltaproteobacteria bacterium]